MFAFLIMAILEIYILWVVNDLMTNVGPEARPVEKHWFKEYKVN